MKPYKCYANVVKGEGDANTLLCHWIVTARAVLLPYARTELSI